MTMKKIPYLLLAVFTILIFGLTFRGAVGNPTPEQIQTELNQRTQAFESSQERARYALILAMVNEKTVAIDTYAALAAPDVGYINGHYFTLFPPMTSVLALPLYLLGTHLGMAQIFTFLTPTIFSILTMLLSAEFCRRLKLHWSLGLLAAIAYGFGTNAFGYAVTLYAHTISAFFILLGLYCTVFLKNWKGSLLFWLCYAISVLLDFPNIFIFFPMALANAFFFFETTSTPGKKIKIKLHWQYFFLPFVFIALMTAYAAYNNFYHGSPTVLSNTIPRVESLEVQSLPAPDQVTGNNSESAASALEPRNMLEGFRSFLISKDRGVLIYSPIVLLSILGIGVLKNKQKNIEVLLLSVPATCFILYTMFGDPYGGWAFGSRYVLAIFPELAILMALGLARWQKRYQLLASQIFYSLVFMYSSAVSLLAPLTTNVLPPTVEALPLGLESTYRENITLLQNNMLSSFVYNFVLPDNFSGVSYYAAIAGLIILVGLCLIWWPKGKYVAE